MLYAKTGHDHAHAAEECGVALDHGYRRFTAMFKRHFGVMPAVLYP